ncbi:MAG: hypothetical protein JW745_08105 [Sedimentisphaerales bacterium]|nr:hypothetical protein [Sedimentisphaerales bacterium]
MYSDKYDEDGAVGPDIEDTDDYRDPVRFEDEVIECPKCGKQVYSENDSCPYCGDIMFRYLRHGTFAPKNKMLARIFLVVIILCVIFVIIGLAI